MKTTINDLLAEFHIDVQPILLYLLENKFYSIQRVQVLLEEVKDFNTVVILMAHNLMSNETKECLRQAVTLGVQNISQIQTDKLVSFGFLVKNNDAIVVPKLVFNYVLLWDKCFPKGILK